MVEIFILSIIQGISEFIPISSSSHLIIISKVFNFSNESLSIDVSLHIGSFIAVIFYFRKELLNFLQNKELFLRILISSLPVMIVGYLLTRYELIHQLRSLKIIGWTTIIFGIFLFLSDKNENKKKLKDNFNVKSAFFIGLLQILSLIPGVSRSGIAITASRFLKFNRSDPQNIFFLSIPILAAVSVYGLNNILISDNPIFSNLNLIAIFLSFIFSYFTIKYFLIYLKKFNLNIFVLYRILLGLLVLTFAYL